MVTPQDRRARGAGVPNLSRAALIGTVLLAAPSCGAAPLPASAPSPVPGVELPQWIHGLASRAGDELWVRNDSDAFFRVVAVTVRDCMNVEGPCGERPVAVTVCPGEAVRVGVVRPVDRNAAWIFNWELQMERYEALSDRVGLECGR